MENTDKHFLDILKYNQGFDKPQDWIEYAKQHNFTKVKAIKLIQCPDCKSIDFKEIGKYVYYSQLIRIKECKNCSLIFSDVILDKEILKKHFEVAYKDDIYFERKRRPIFNQILKTLLREYSDKKDVLDIGGAKGHFGKMLKEKNLRYNITVNDVSQIACEFASEKIGLKSICCPLEDLVCR